MVGAMMAPAPTKPTKVTTSRTRSKRRGTPRCRPINVAIAYSSSAEPVAITAAARMSPSTVALATKLPSQMPGHSRRSQSSSAASPMPDGGHTAVA